MYKALCYVLLLMNRFSCNYKYLNHTTHLVIQICFIIIEHKLELRSPIRWSDNLT